MEEFLRNLSLWLAAAAGAWIAILVILAVCKRERPEGQKKFLFFGIAVAVIIVTGIMAGGTIFLNITSVTRGPVHWHADFRIFDCGEEITLKEAHGLANRIGAPTLHEHGDSRIHVEGVIEQYQDVSLERFFETIGGTAQDDRLEIPTNDGLAAMQTGIECPDGRIAELQIFRWYTLDGRILQTKLSDWPNHVPAPYALVPPGDCIIFELTPDIKDKTEKLCRFYEIELNKGTYKLDLK